MTNESTLADVTDASIKASSNYHKLPSIVIVGGGAGGLELATKLGDRFGKKGDARILLVDLKLTHVWKPLLHEVAAGSFDSNSNETSYRAHAKLHHFEFYHGRLSGLNRHEKRITLAPLMDSESGEELVGERIISYHWLVLAVGSTSNDFGVSGAKAHCLWLDNLDQAKLFHRRLLNTLIKKNFQQEEKQINIAIVGAGATGVELAAELRHAGTGLSSYGLHNLAAEAIHITLVERADRVVPGLPERLSIGVSKRLTNLNITTLLNTAVEEVKPNGLCLAGKGLNGAQSSSLTVREKTSEEEGYDPKGFFKTDLMVWAAGIKAPEFLTELDGLETNKLNQIVVKQNLQSTVDEAVYAIGDCACCPQEGAKHPVPARAQAAHQQADTLLRTFQHLLKGEGESETFIYRDYGSLLSISGEGAVGKLMGNIFADNFFIEGKLARLFYISLYRMHQLALHGYIRTFLYWSNDLFNKLLKPRLKLH